MDKGEYKELVEMDPIDRMLMERGEFFDMLSSRMRPFPAPKAMVVSTPNGFGYIFDYGYDLTKHFQDG